MDDSSIVTLFLERKEEAILQAQIQYKKYCTSISFSILQSSQDAEECVNDAFLRAWETIPPKHPLVLSAYLGKLTRNLSLDRLRSRTADKRDERLQLALDEIECILPGESSTEQDFDRKALAEIINAFLEKCSKTKRLLFIGRYWNLLSVTELSKQFGYSESMIKTTLHRTREELRDFLTKEGYEI